MAALQRTISTNFSNQIISKTCALHMITKLYVKNIFKLYENLPEPCMILLSPDDVDYESTPELLLELCETEENRLKGLMFLYVYHVILDKYSTIASSTCCSLDNSL